jgi:hypothetical protein
VKSGHVPPGATNREWQAWYKGYLLTRPEISELLRKNQACVSTPHNEKNTRGCPHHSVPGTGCGSPKN